MWAYLLPNPSAKHKLSIRGAGFEQRGAGELEQRVTSSTAASFELSTTHYTSRDEITTYHRSRSR